MNIVYNALKRKLRGKYMPTYIPQYRAKSFKIEVVPSDEKRKMIRAMPFYSGTNIMFDLRLTVFQGNKINEDFKIEWALYDEKDNKIKSGMSEITFSDIRSTRWGWLKFWKVNKNHIERYNYSNAVAYTKLRAIEVGRLLKLNTYQLRARIQSEAIKSEDMLLVQFTIKDIEEHGNQIVYLILSAGFGAIAGLICSILYLGFFGGR
jgi:hypothetical protein